MNEFDPYVSPTASCLTEWQGKIEEMRSLEWPYWKIAEWLLSEHKLTVHKDTIRKFCLVRKIQKGVSVSPPKQKKKLESRSPPAPKNSIFSYNEEDSDRPIQIKRR